MIRNFCGKIDLKKSIQDNVVSEMAEKLNFSSQYNISILNDQNAQIACLKSKKHSTDNSSDFIKEVANKYKIASYSLLTNQSQLCQSLDISENKNIDPNEIILKAYLKWGKNCSKKLLGDWAYVIWDALEQKVIMANCQVGETSLFYTIQDSAIYFSTLLTGLIGIKGVPVKLNDEKIFTEFFQISEYKNHTIYKDIFFIPYGHNATFDLIKGLKKHQYWNLKHTKPLKLKSDNEYVKTFYDTFKNTVDNVMKHPVNWMGTLSGGLDSSSCSYFASKFLEKQNKSLDVFSYSQHFNDFDKLAPKSRSGNEKPYIEILEKALENVNVNYVSKSPEGFLDYLTCNFNNFKHPPVNVNYWWLEAICTKAKQSNKGNGILAAEGGNTTISYEGRQTSCSLSQYFADLKAGLQLNKSDAIKLFIKSLKGSLKKSIKSIPFIKNRSFKKHINNSSFASNSFYEKVNGYRIMNDYYFNINKSSSPSLKDRFKALSPNHCRFGLMNEIGSKYDLFFLNIPRSKEIQEFTVATPNHLYNRLGTQKYIYKQAFKNKLPDEIVFNNKKALQLSDIVQLFRSDLDKLQSVVEEIKQSELCKRYLDMKRLDVFFQKLSNPNYFTEAFTYEVFSKSTSLMLAMFFVWLEKENILTA